LDPGGSDEMWLRDGNDSFSDFDFPEAQPIPGSADDDRVFLGPGLDIGDGAAGADHIEGGEDPDRLNGNDGNDYLDGGEGFDYLDGGPGRDQCLRGEDISECEE